MKGSVGVRSVRGMDARIQIHQRCTRSFQSPSRRMPCRRRLILLLLRPPDEPHSSSLHDSDLAVWEVEVQTVSPFPVFTTTVALRMKQRTVNTTPHTSIFALTTCTRMAQVWVSTHSISCFMCHLVCPSRCSLFDDSIFLSLLTIFFLITLSFLLPVNFTFQDVVDKFPVHFRQ